MHPHPAGVRILHQPFDVAVLAGLNVLDCEATDADIGIVPAQAFEFVKAAGAVSDWNALLARLSFKAGSHALYDVIAYDDIYVQLEEVLHIVAVDEVDIPA